MYKLKRRKTPKKTMSDFATNLKNRVKSFLKDPFFLSHWDTLNPYNNNDDKYISAYIGLHRRKPDTYVHSPIVIENMCNGLMPFTFYQGVKEKYPTLTIPTSQEKEFLIADAIDEKGSLADALCVFVRNTAKQLFMHGVVLYEIGYKKDKDNQIKWFGLKPIPTFRIFKLFNNYYQFVLWDDAKQLRAKVQIRKIPAQNVLRIDFPKEYGGKKRLTRCLKRIEDLDKEVIPKFFIEDLNYSTKFNQKEYYRTKFLEKMRTTKQFGWYSLDSYEYTTEYYSISLFLRKKKTEAVIRNLIISKLNQILNKKPLDLGIRVEMKNLFTLEDVEKKQKELESGNTNFTDIINSFDL